MLPLFALAAVLRALPDAASLLGQGDGTFWALPALAPLLCLPSLPGVSPLLIHLVFLREKKKKRWWQRAVAEQGERGLLRLISQQELTVMRSLLPHLGKSQE